MSQKVKPDYLIGNWQLVSSMEKPKEQVEFGKLGKLTFYGTEKTTWKYTLNLKDTVIFLDYNIFAKKVTLHNEAVLVVQSNECFWWFNRTLYEQYVEAVSQGRNKIEGLTLDEWLKRNRDIFKRVVRKS